jgi:hypothetical protein
MCPPLSMPFLITTHDILFLCNGGNVYELSDVALGVATKEKNHQDDVYHVWMINLRELNSH